MDMDLPNAEMADNTVFATLPRFADMTTSEWASITP